MIGLRGLPPAPEMAPDSARAGNRGQYSGTMSRFGKAFAAVAVVVVSGALVAGAAGTPASAGVNDFTITSFVADYYLDRDDSGHSTLRTVETIEAVFPPNQNHGILRDIPTSYDGHPVNLHIESVNKSDGSPWSYSAEDTDNGYRELRIGSANRYVEGTQTFVISYTQSNVTKSFSDTGADEFYWDVNGTEWAQPFGVVTARVHLGGGLTEALNGQSACYRGYFGSTQACEPEYEGTMYTFSANDLNPHENLTFAIGFEPQTFTPRDDSPFSSPLFWLQSLLGVVSLIVLIWSIRLRASTFRDQPGRPTIVAEYLPPKDVSVITAAILYKTPKRAVAAQLLDLAVRKNIRVLSSPAQGFFASGEDYVVELQSADGLRYDENKLASKFFGSGMQRGASRALSKNDTTLGEAIYKLMQSFKKAVYRSGFYRPVPASARALPPLIASASLGFGFFLLVGLISDARNPLLPMAIFLLTLTTFIVSIAVVSRRPLTREGAELRDHLEGLRLYISVAETDRIRMLQSPTGAERIDTNDRGVMVKLYERVLPYAVLFNQEKEWAKQLGDYYDDQPPDWYSGSTAFNSAVFASSIGSMSSTAAAGYSGTSSSSSGGSGGGGSSGGGGGGGGGGGW
jgi:uncharacterized membrane protein YgcG